MKTHCTASCNNVLDRPHVAPTKVVFLQEYIASYLRRCQILCIAMLHTTVLWVLPNPYIYIRYIYILIPACLCHVLTNCTPSLLIHDPMTNLPLLYKRPLLWGPHEVKYTLISYLLCDISAVGFLRTCIIILHQ